MHFDLSDLYLDSRSQECKKVKTFAVIISQKSFKLIWIEKEEDRTYVIL